MTLKGTISKRVISGRTYYYHQYLEEGKQISKTLGEDEAYALAFRLYFRGEDEEAFLAHRFHANVSYGTSLFQMAKGYRGLKKRRCYPAIPAFLSDPKSVGKLLILYGLRRTGKTTLLFQTIEGLSIKDFAHAAYIKCEHDNSMRGLLDDLSYLLANGINYVFIDEVTLLDDFIGLSSTLSDVFGTRARIVLSGTDSLGFLLASHYELYDRCRIIETTYIPFGEFAEVLGLKSIDRYIEFGGTMSMEGVDYNNAIRDGDSEVNEYVDSSIVHNIIHSLKSYGDGKYFFHLYDLYEKGELANIINRIIEDQNHRFAISTIEREFKSHDYGSLKQLLKLPANYERFSNILDKVDEEALVRALMERLDILDKEQQTHKVDEAVLAEVKEYLFRLDVLAKIREIVAPEYQERERMVFTQPGLRYSQAKSLVQLLFKDESLSTHNGIVLRALEEKLLSDVKGRMIEEIVLMEASSHGKDAFKLYFPGRGEFDMVVLDHEALAADLYEIKYSTERDPRQARFLTDEALCGEFERKYVPIRNRIVLYRGESGEWDGIEYRNIEEFLCSLH